MKPDAVNDIVFTDGSAMSHADFDALDSAQKNQKSTESVLTRCQ